MAQMTWLGLRNINGLRRGGNVRTCAADGRNCTRTENGGHACHGGVGWRGVVCVQIIFALGMAAPRESPGVTSAGLGQSLGCDAHFRSRRKAPPSRVSDGPVCMCRLARRSSLSCHLARPVRYAREPRRGLFAVELIAGCVWVAHEHANA